MLRMMTSGLFIMGLVTAPVVLSPRQAPAPAPDYRNDPRLETLRTFFHNAHCPAEQDSAAFLEAADHYALDWGLLPSLSYVETTGGKSAHNNKPSSYWPPPSSKPPTTTHSTGACCPAFRTWKRRVENPPTTTICSAGIPDAHNSSRRSPVSTR